MNIRIKITRIHKKAIVLGVFLSFLVLSSPSAFAATITYISNDSAIITVAGGANSGGASIPSIPSGVSYKPDNASLGFSNSPDTHLCVINLSSSIYCAGRNQSGELGNSNTSSFQSTPVTFNLPAGLVAQKVIGSAQFTCALASNNQVYCAGANSTGQLGNGNTTNQSTPVKFNLPTGLTADNFSIGREYTCALASDNQVYCAGFNSNGQLGNGNTTNQSTPVKFNLPTGLTAQKVGSYMFNSCALASNNQVYCAGANSTGQLGNGNTTNQSTPVKFNLPTGLTAQDLGAGGFNSTCALASNDQVYCAGRNNRGNLGNGNTTNQSTPVRFNLPVGLTAQKVVIPKADQRHTCALASNNQVYCAGLNSSGQLGNGNTTNQSTPVKFNLPTGLTAQDLGAGADHNCALASNNQVYCSGSGASGTRGNGVSSNTSTPALFLLTNAPAGSIAQAVGVREIGTCAIVSDNQLYCAGANSEGQLGDGTTAIRATPVKFQLP